MSRPVITVENLSKAYRIGLKEEVPDTLVGALKGFVRNPLAGYHRLRRLDTFTGESGESPDVVWALKDVSFEVAEGEVVGIIGRNGAGKSTLLKILSRITEPTGGRAVIRGRVSSLLEVGTGFHPELTGRENIYMNGTILGMRKREIDRKFDEIVDFSGVEKFLDTPIKRYSSGMQVRLAFAVAAHLEPEILIIDEVLAVGDAEFQKKCLGKMQDVARGGRTVLVVSHNMSAIANMCSIAAVFYLGSLHGFGEPRTQIQSYLNTHGMRDGASLALRADRRGDGSVRATGIALAGPDGRPLHSASSGRPLTIRVSYSSETAAAQIQAYIWICTDLGERITCLANSLTADPLHAEASGIAECDIPILRLIPGQYSLELAILRDGCLSDHVIAAHDLLVEAGPFFPSGRLPERQNGFMLTDQRWRHIPHADASPTQR